MLHAVCLLRVVVEPHATCRLGTAHHVAALMQGREFRTLGGLLAGVTAVNPPAAGPDDPQPGRLPGGRGSIVKGSQQLGRDGLTSVPRAC